MASDELPYLLEPLGVHHAVAAFRCENDELNDYLWNESLADAQRRVARVFVLLDSSKPTAENVAGFFALRTHALRIRESYFEDWEGGADGGASHPIEIEVPLVELMWLARDLRWKGMGLGDLLMLEALSLVERAARCVGFIGVHLRSTPQAVPLYRRFQFDPFTDYARDASRYILPVGRIQGILTLDEE